MRPEEFGALLYHYGTRRLTFLKDPRLLDVVRALEVQPSVPAACRAAGLTDEQVPSFVAAVARLAAIDMLVPAAERTPTPSPRSPG